MVRWSHVVLAATVAGCLVAPLVVQAQTQQQTFDPLAAVHQLVAAAPTQHEIDHLDRMIDLAAARTPVAHAEVPLDATSVHDTNMLETETVTETESGTETEVDAEAETEADSASENKADATLGIASTLAGFGRDTDLARLTKLSQSLAATKHAVERQRHQITADESKLQRLRRLIAENKETLVRNERALAASSQQYLKAVEQYTTQVNEAVVESLQATQEAARAQVASLVGGQQQRGGKKASPSNAADQSNDITPAPKPAPKLGPEDDYAEKLVSGKLEAEQKAAARARVKRQAEEAAARAAQAIAQSKISDMKSRAAATAAAAKPTSTPTPAAAKPAAATPPAAAGAVAPKRSMISLESQLAAEASAQADSSVSLHAAQVSEARRAAQHAEEMARLVASKAAAIGSQYAAETANTALPTTHQQDFAEFKAGLARLATLETQRTDSVQQALNMPATAPSFAELEGEPVAIFLEMEAEADPAEEDASTTKKKLMKPRIEEGIISPPLPPAPIATSAAPVSSLPPCPTPVAAGSTSLLEAVETAEDETEGEAEVEEEATNEEA